MFDKIQMILMMKTSISNNRISQLNDDSNKIVAGKMKDETAIKDMEK